MKNDYTGGGGRRKKKAYASNPSTTAGKRYVLRGEKNGVKIYDEFAYPKAKKQKRKKATMSANRSSRSNRGGYTKKFR